MKRISYAEAKSILEENGVKFGDKRSPRNNEPISWEEPRQRKTRMSPSQARRAGLS